MTQGSSGGRGTMVPRKTEITGALISSDCSVESFVSFLKTFDGQS